MPEQKKYYTVKVEAIIPTEVTYKIFAETPEQAIDLISKSAPYLAPKPKLSRMKKIKITVYKFGTSMVELIKKFS